MDASLLETEYDAVLVGTGMAEAILAGALARAGKKVLHLDQNDYYGSNYASFPLKQFLQWTRNESAAPRRYDCDDDDDTSADAGAHPLTPESAASAASPPPTTSADDEAAASTTRDVAIKSSLRCNLLELAFADSATEQALLRQSSTFSIDINPRLVLSSEELVETLITSGVGQYLEFTAVQHTYVHLQPETSKATSSVTVTDTVWEVPCSKKDVFQSKLLGMVEKRQLMKFLQFVADYGETHIAGEDVGTKNERSLALGRALKRPQNKTNQADDGAIAPFLDRPFQDLLEQHFRLSPKLQQVVVYCVGLASFPAARNQISGRDGLAAVYRYVASIGRFTSTAFLVPLYGVSEIAQSFCRLCAVYGGIYVLRAPITAFVLDHAANSVVGVRTTDGGMLRAKHIVVNGSYVESFTQEGTREGARTHGQILRGVYLLTASLRHAMSRLMVVIPPEDAAFGNPFAIQVVQLDAGACVCPRDYFLVHVSMTLPPDWIDDTARQLQLVTAVMQRLVTSALAESAAQPGNAKAAATAADDSSDPDTPSASPQWTDAVAWRAVYTMDHLASSATTTNSLAHKTSHLPTNLWPCETRVGAATQGAAATPVNPLEIHLESASANARAIFEQLCPGEEFLPKSASAEQAEKEALEDEHGAVLQAAQKLAEQTSLSSSSSSSDDGGVAATVAAAPQDSSVSPTGVSPVATTAVTAAGFESASADASANASHASTLVAPQP